METYKAKIYPGRLMDAALSVATPLSFAVGFFGIIICMMQEWAGALLFVVPAFVYLLNGLLRRRLGINISADGIALHYLPQLFFQRGETIHLSFAEVADCKKAVLRFGRYRNSFLIILLRNSKQYMVLSWVPPFEHVETYASNCEEAICVAFQKFKQQNN